MKIGFDGKRATQNFTGLGNYSRYVLALLSRHKPDPEYVVYALKPPSSVHDIKNVVYKYPAGRFFKSLWRSFGIIDDLKKDKIALFHGLSNEIPFGLKKAGIPSVVTIHDLIFLRYPEYFKPADRMIYRLKFRHAALNADRVIAISEQTKKDLIHYFGADESRVEVIYQNCDPIFRNKITETEKEDIRKRYGLPKKYLLNVGTIEERKNLMMLVQALNNLTDIQLVVVGRETKYTEGVKEYIRRNGLTERVLFLKNVLHQDLPGIYQQAEIFIYPSRFEGFGIPVVEALHSGVPVIAATGSCLEEAGGPGSIYVDPDDPDALSEQISNVLTDSDKRNTMINEGYLYLKKFEDEKIADQIMQLYNNILNHA